MGRVIDLDPQLRRVVAQARPYPAHLLPFGGSALALFAAAFHGQNDVIWFAQAGMTATCVDIDADKIADMALTYPIDWDFRCRDAWAFAERARTCGDMWDVVSVDTFTGDAEDRSVDSLELWTSLARSLVTVTVTPRVKYRIPEGWCAWLHERAPGVSWLVLNR